MPIRRPVRLSGKRSKYGAVPTVVDNIRFASKREAARYGELKMLDGLGEIHGLRLQPVFPLWAFSVNNEPEPVGVYRADFAYCTCDSVVCDDSREVVEDVKGVRTALYRWKKRHVNAQYGIEIRET